MNAQQHHHHKNPNNQTALAGQASSQRLHLNTQKADLKTEDEMRSALDTFRAELFGRTHDLESALRQFDSHALDLLRGRLSYIVMRLDEIRG